MTDEQRNDKDMAHLRAGYVPLKEYVDSRFTALERAVDKAEKTLCERLAGMNEFRDQLKDQAATFISRRELEAMIRPFDEEIKILRDFMSKTEGKASQSALVFTALVAIIGLIIGGVALFLK